MNADDEELINVNTARACDGNLFAIANTTPCKIEPRMLGLVIWSFLQLGATQSHILLPGLALPCRRWQPTLHTSTCCDGFLARRIAYSAGMIGASARRANTVGIFSLPNKACTAIPPDQATLTDRPSVRSIPTVRFSLLHAST